MTTNGTLKSISWTYPCLSQTGVSSSLYFFWQPFCGRAAPGQVRTRSFCDLACLDFITPRGAGRREGRSAPLCDPPPWRDGLMKISMGKHLEFFRVCMFFQAEPVVGSADPMGICKKTRAICKGLTKICMGKHIEFVGICMFFQADPVVGSADPTLICKKP